MRFAYQIVAPFVLLYVQKTNISISYSLLEVETNSVNSLQPLTVSYSVVQFINLSGT